MGGTDRAVLVHARVCSAVGDMHCALCVGKTLAEYGLGYLGTRN